MIIDAQTQFSNNQAITASAASTNIYDFGATPTGKVVDAGPGSPIKLAGTVIAAFNNLTSLSIAVQTSNDPTFATGVSTLETVTMTLAQLVANAPILFPALTGGLLRYLQIYYTVTGTNPSTGTVSVEMVDTLQANAGVPELVSP